MQETPRLVFKVWTRLKTGSREWRNLASLLNEGGTGVGKDFLISLATFFVNLTPLWTILREQKGD